MATYPPYLHAIRRRTSRAGQSARAATTLGAALLLGACAAAYVASRPTATVTVENRAFEQAVVEVLDSNRLVARLRVPGVTGRVTKVIRLPVSDVMFCVKFLARNDAWCSQPIMVNEGDDVLLVIQQTRLEQPYTRR